MSGKKPSTKPAPPAKRTPWVRDRIADVVFRVRCSWWAPSAILTMIASTVLYVTGKPVIVAALPPVAALAALFGIKDYRARIIPGARLAPRAAITRHHWAKAMTRHAERFTYAAHPARAFLTGHPTQTPRIKRFHQDGPTLVVVAESPWFLDVSIWRQNGDELARALRLPRPQVSIDTAAKEATLTFVEPQDVISGLTQWTPEPIEWTPQLLHGAPLARTVDGKPWRVPIFENHLLVVGLSRSGKGSALWSLIHVLKGGIVDGTVRVFAIDPKQGVEMVTGEPMFWRFIAGEGRTDGKPWQEGLIEGLEEIEHVLQDRGAAMRRARIRKTDPSPEWPQYVIIIDEFLTLTFALVDPDQKRRFQAAMSTILTQGAALGISVVALAQQAQKRFLDAYRDAFLTRVALRVADAGQVDMILGDGARHVAPAHQIHPTAERGVAYVRTDDGATTRVRFPWVSDAAIRAMAAAYPAPRSTAGYPVADDPAAPTTQPLPTRPVPAKPPTKEDVLCALIADGVTDPAQLAAESGASERYARMILRKEQDGGENRGATSTAPSAQPLPVRRSHPGGSADRPGNPGNDDGNPDASSGNAFPELEPSIPHQIRATSLSDATTLDVLDDPLRAPR